MSGAYGGKYGSGTKRQDAQGFQSTGSLIMEIAELLRPSLMKRLEHCKDENGMPVQPARVRGIALIIAQEIVKQQKAA